MKLFSELNDYAFGIHIYSYFHGLLRKVLQGGQMGYR